jgi:hypothetical protein
MWIVKDASAQPTNIQTLLEIVTHVFSSLLEATSDYYNYPVDEIAMTVITVGTGGPAAGRRWKER